MRRLIITLAIVVATTSGCSVFNPVGSSEFACSGKDSGGAECKTPREVYKISDTDKPANKSELAAVPTYIYATEHQSGGLNPVPILEQAKVMRIWIAPWVDNNNDQHWPGLVFTIIQPKQWHFGEEGFQGVEPPIPHRMFIEPPRPKEEEGKKNSSVEMPSNEGEVLN